MPACPTSPRLCPPLQSAHLYALDELDQCAMRLRLLSENEARALLAGKG